jgi:SAM-dependent methyltransferase
MFSKVRSKLIRGLKYLSGQKGYCPICEKPVRFVKFGEWMRDFYKCSGCRSIPRYRALIDSLKRFYPNWRELAIHESSPNNGSSSAYVKKGCKDYSASQYYPDVPRGEYKSGYRSEDLSALTFPDESFDLFITQDVFEHVMEPGLAFKEIARVLKPGGAHIFSMPWYPELKITRRRAKVEDGQIIYLEDPVYHGNPVDPKKGSLVTFDWGQDFVDFIYKSSGMYTTIYLQHDKSKGLEAEFLEIFISRKP